MFLPIVTSLRDGTLQNNARSGFLVRLDILTLETTCRSYLLCLQKSWWQNQLKLQHVLPSSIPVNAVHGHCWRLRRLKDSTNIHKEGKTKACHWCAPSLGIWMHCEELGRIGFQLGPLLGGRELSRTSLCHKDLYVTYSSLMVLYSGGSSMAGIIWFVSCCMYGWFIACLLWFADFVIQPTFWYIAVYNSSILRHESKIKENKNKN